MDTSFPHNITLHVACCCSTKLNHYIIKKVILQMGITINCSHGSLLFFLLL